MGYEWIRGRVCDPKVHSKIMNLTLGGYVWHRVAPDPSALCVPCIGHQFSAHAEGHRAGISLSCPRRTGSDPCVSVCRPPRIHGSPGRKGPNAELSSELEGQRWGPGDSEAMGLPRLLWGWSWEPSGPVVKGRPCQFSSFWNSCFIPQNLTVCLFSKNLDISIILLRWIVFSMSMDMKLYLYFC